MSHNFFSSSLAVFVVAATLIGCTNNPSSAASTPADTSQQGHDLPALVVKDAPPPSVIYRPGLHDTLLDSNGANASSSLDTKHIETIVTRKAQDISHDLEQLQSNTEDSAQQLQAMREKSDGEAASYYTLVASISAALQAGTTFGNPILVDRWNTAQDRLNHLSEETSILNTLSTDISHQASRAAFLLESTEAAFSISGAVDEDHKKLSALEDGVNQNIVTIQHLMTKVNDELSRRTAYLRTERANLQVLSASIANGELYGQSLTNSVFKKATTGSTLATAVPATKRPLVVIRFDHPNVNYDVPLYNAINQALEKYPAAKFDLVALSPSEGNPAQLAIASTEARKNGEAVLRTLTQMGLPLERVHLSAGNSKDVLNTEIHIYIR